MTTYLGKSCSFGLPRVPFVNCRQFMYLVISRLVLRAGCGIWFYQFLIIAYIFTFQCGICKKYCKASDRLLECEECEKRFHTSCPNLGDNELWRIESGDGAWYCTNCKADCCLCSGVVLKITKQFGVTVVIWGSIMNAHSLQKLSMKLWTIQTVHGFAPKCEFFNFWFLLWWTGELGNCKYVCSPNKREER